MCIIYHFQHFLDNGFKIQLTVGNGCHNVLMMSIDINSIAIFNIHGVGYCCIIDEITK